MNKKIVLQNVFSNLRFCINWSVSSYWKCINNIFSELVVGKYVLWIPFERLFEYGDYMLVISTSEVKIHIHNFFCLHFLLTIG